MALLFTVLDWIGVILFSAVVFYIFKIDIAANLFPWLRLVIMADLPIMALAIGLSLYSEIFSKIYNLAGCVIFIFISTWVYAMFSGNNICSQIIAFVTFMALAWQCREKNINISILWIFYGCLNFPFRLLFTSFPESFNHTLFLLLLTSKISLISAMYKML